MPERPDTRELLEAVQEYLVNEVAPAASDPRSRFRALVAANVLAIAARETPEADPGFAQEDRELTDAVRSGSLSVRPGDETWTRVRRSLVKSLAVSNPRFLQQTGYHEYSAK